MSTASVAFQSEAVASMGNHEIVQVCVIGSLGGISTVIHSLHKRGFAEPNDWCKPQPTGKPNEYISILLKSISRDRQ